MLSALDERIGSCQILITKPQKRRLHARDLPLGCCQIMRKRNRRASARGIRGGGERADDGLPTHRAAAQHDRHRARSRPGPVQGQCATLHGRHLPLGQHEEARRNRRARHVGAGTIWRARPAGVRYRADPRGNCKDLLRHRDGDARRGRRPDPRHRDLRARRDPPADFAQSRLRRLHPGSLHDRTACRHRRR